MQFIWSLWDIWKAYMLKALWASIWCVRILVFSWLSYACSDTGHNVLTRPHPECCHYYSIFKLMFPIYFPEHVSKLWLFIPPHMNEFHQMEFYIPITGILMVICITQWTLMTSKSITPIVDYYIKSLDEKNFMASFFRRYEFYDLVYSPVPYWNHI